MKQWCLSFNPALCVERVRVYREMKEGQGMGLLTTSCLVSFPDAMRM